MTDKLKRYSNILEDKEEMFDHDDYNDDDINDIDEDDISQYDIMTSLVSTLRKMVKASDIKDYSLFVDEDDLSINIQFILDRKETIGNIMKIMNLMKKFSTDILIEYDAEFELWETKDDYPYFQFKFFYNENESGKYSDDVPF